MTERLWSVIEALTTSAVAISITVIIVAIVAIRLLARMNQRVESFTARDRIRLACTIGLVYETTTDQMRTILAALEAILRAHPKIWSDSVVVRFARFSDSSLDIDIMAWFETRGWSEFQGVRQDILIAFMEAIAHAGSSIAFPTRTLHVVDHASEQQALPRRAAQGNGSE